MSIIKFQVRFLEPFKDGNIFGSKSFKTNEVATIEEEQLTKARNSGAALEVLQTLVPNPLRHIKPEETPALVEAGLSEKLELTQPVDETPQPKDAVSKLKKASKKHG